MPPHPALHRIRKANVERSEPTRTEKTRINLKAGQERDERSQRLSEPRRLAERHYRGGPIKIRIADEVLIRIDRNDRNLHHERSEHKEKKIALGTKTDKP